MTEALSVLANPLAVAVVFAVVDAIVAQRRDQSNCLRYRAIVEKAQVPTTGQQVM